MSDTLVKTRWRIAAQKSTPVNLPEQTKLPGVISDKDKDKTLSTIKTVIQNIRLGNKRCSWAGKSLVHTAGRSTAVQHSSAQDPCLSLSPLPRKSVGDSLQQDPSAHTWMAQLHTTKTERETTTVWEWGCCGCCQWLGLVWDSTTDQVAGRLPFTTGHGKSVHKPCFCRNTCAYAQEGLKGATTFSTIFNSPTCADGCHFPAHLMKTFKILLAFRIS